MASISTIMPPGSEPMPTAERAWRPASGVGEVGLGVDHAEQFDHDLDR